MVVPFLSPYQSKSVTKGPKICTFLSVRALLRSAENCVLMLLSVISHRVEPVPSNKVRGVGNRVRRCHSTEPHIQSGRARGSFCSASSDPTITIKNLSSDGNVVRASGSSLRPSCRCCMHIKLISPIGVATPFLGQPGLEHQTT